MFDHHLQHLSADVRRVHCFYEKLYVTIDVLAAVCFVVGSVMFFSEAWQIPATWFFLVGSLFFLAKPLSRFLREFHLANLPLPTDTSDADTLHD